MPAPANSVSDRLDDPLSVAEEQLWDFPEDDGEELSAALPFLDKDDGIRKEDEDIEKGGSSLGGLREPRVVVQTEKVRSPLEKVRSEGGEEKPQPKVRIQKLLQVHQPGLRGEEARREGSGRPQVSVNDVRGPA
ncbi:uncharacterized protein LOC144716125 [Wolffia australiana]